MYLWAVYNPADEQLAKVVSGISWYVLEDGSCVQIDEQVAWCGRCNRFRMTEQLLRPEQKRQQIERIFWLRFPDERTAFLREALHRLQEEVAHERAPWTRYLASRRASPARCLECGSTDLRIPPGDPQPGEWFPHPTEQILIRIRWAGHADATVERLYTPEGLFIPPQATRLLRNAKAVQRTL
jgi:hypothetical protein